MKKFLLALSVLCLISGSLAAQDIVSDSTASIDIENPMNAVPQQLQVLGVEVEGLTTSREQFVIGTSGLQEGTQITVPGEDLGRAIKSLYRTGLFSNIEIIQTGRESGGIYLKIIVQEQPRRRRPGQFAGRLAGAVGADPPPHPPARRGEERPGLRLRRGRRRLGRLHDRVGAAVGPHQRRVRGPEDGDHRPPQTDGHVQRRRVVGDEHP